jgi:peptidoglycan/LPS O-acetylase OafA/YrhL
MFHGLEHQVKYPPAQTAETASSVRMPGPSHLFRNDIEGLRGLAVLSVLTNHAFPKALPGGFAGVDIFFVISGYLIGWQLLQDIQAERLSILGFYGRRARRIFPALTLVLVSVWCVSWVVFTVPEFIVLGQHILAATFFSNNILLWSESGYFDITALDKPLLHLWSLGIEEQFYLLAPAMLWMGTTGKKGSIRWVARLGALSLLATMFLSDFDYASSFYLLHTRFWELAVGVVLAQIGLHAPAKAQQQRGIYPASKRDGREILIFCSMIVFGAVLVLGSGDAPWEWNKFLRDAGLFFAIAAAAATAFLVDCYAHPDAWSQFRSWLVLQRGRASSASSLVGILLIGTSVVALRPVDWPGAQTLFPVLGTALVIAGGPTETINRLLGSKPLAFIGGISYPLYLWHWPAIVFFKLLNPEPTAIAMAIPLSASLVLAWLTKTLLEDPVRFGKLGSVVFQRPPLGTVVLGLVCAGFLGSLVVENDGLPSRLSPRLRAIAEWSDVNPDISWRAGHCYFHPSSKQDFSKECTPVKRPGVPLILLWGDSHAAHLYPGLAYVQSTVAMDIAQWTAAGCPPVLQPFDGEYPTCAKIRETAIKRLTQLDPDTIVLGGAWERYMELGQSPMEIRRALSETIHHLKNLGTKRIVVFGPGPLWATSLPIDLFRFMARSHSNEIPDRLGRVSNEIWHLDAALAALADAEKVQYVSVLNFFCDKDGCLTLGDKRLKRPDLLYRDRDHLTATGSRVLIEHSKDQLFGDNSRPHESFADVQERLAK